VAESVTVAPFTDVPAGEWFARFVAKAKEMGIVKGNDVDGTFAPGRQVNKAEFIKMLLMANQINTDALKGQETGVADVAKDAWFAPYMMYAAGLGIITKTADNKLEPEKP